MRGGHTVRAHQLQQVPGVAVPKRFGKHQLRTADQRQEQLPDRHIERVRRFLDEHVRGASAVLLLHPEQSVADGAVADHHALGLCGGPGCEHHIGQVSRRDIGVVCSPATDRVVPQRRDGDGRCSAMTAQMFLAVCRCQYHANLGVVQRAAEPCRGPVQSQRDIRRPCVEGSQQAGNHLEGPLRADADPILQADAAPGKLSCDGLGPGIQLAVSEPVFTSDQRRGMRGPGRLCCDQMLNRCLVGLGWARILRGFRGAAGVRHRVPSAESVDDLRGLGCVASVCRPRVASDARLTPSGAVQGR